MALIATMLVNLKANVAQYDKALRSSAARTSEFNRQIQAAGAVAGRALRYVGAAAAGMAAVSLRAYAKQEEAEAALWAALTATGQSAAMHSRGLLESAKAIQRVSTVADEAALGLMKQATNLGVNAERLPEVTRGAIGLAEALGIDVESAVRYVALALQGQFTVLQRYVPALRTATDAGQKLAIVQRLMASGWEQAQERANTFAGRLIQLKNRFGDVAERIGVALVPAAETLLGWLNKLAERLESLSTGEIQAFGEKLIWVAGALAAVWAIGKIAMLIAGLAKLKVMLLAVIPAIKGVGVAFLAAAAPFAAILLPIAAIVAVGVGLILYFKRQAAAANEAAKAAQEYSKSMHDLGVKAGEAEEALEKAETLAERAEALQRLIPVQEQLIETMKREIETSKDSAAVKEGMRRAMKTLEDRVKSGRGELAGWTQEQVRAAAATAKWLAQTKTAETGLAGLWEALGPLQDEYARLTTGISEQEQAWSKLLAEVRVHGTPEQLAVAEDLVNALRNMTGELDTLRTAAEATAAANKRLQDGLAAIGQEMLVLRGIDPAAIAERLTEAFHAAETPLHEMARMTDGLNDALANLTTEQLAELLGLLDASAAPEKIAELARQMAELNRVRQEGEAREKAETDAAERAKALEDFARNVKESLQTPVEQFKAYRERLQEAFEAGLIDEAEMTAALREKMGQLMGRRRDEGTFAEVDLARMSVRGMAGPTAQPELERLDEQIDILDRIETNTRDAGGLT